MSANNITLIDVNSDSFQDLYNRLNQVINVINDDVVTASEPASVTVGSVTLDGDFSANNITVTSSSPANAITVNGNTVWHAGNDGTGSGLDADTVDGVEADAFFLKTGGTITGNVTVSQNLFVSDSANIETLVANTITAESTSDISAIESSSFYVNVNPESSQLKEIEIVGGSTNIRADNNVNILSASTFTVSTGNPNTDRVTVQSDGNIYFSEILGSASPTFNNWKGMAYVGDGLKVSANTDTNCIAVNHIGTGNNVIMTFRQGGNSVAQFLVDNQNFAIQSNKITLDETSDYRRKENIKKLSNISTKVNKIPVYSFNMIGNDEPRYGVLAHELQEIFPHAVSGEKDGLDENGKPIYQGVDYTKLIPLLLASLQESNKEIISLKKQVTSLKNKLES